MKSLVICIVLLLSLINYTRGEDLYYLPSKEVVPLKPLTELKEIIIEITDSVNFNYQAWSVDKKFQGKIWAALPLFERKEEHVSQVKDGFNVGFISSEWLIRFLSHEGFRLEYKNSSIYKFKKIVQNEIALK